MSVVHDLRKERLIELESNIQVGLILLERAGVDRKDVVDAAYKFIDEILDCAENLCEGKGDNYLNADLVIAMMIFYTKATALDKVIGCMAADKGVNRGIFEEEMQLSINDKLLSVRRNKSEKVSEDKFSEN